MPTNPLGMVQSLPSRPRPDLKSCPTPHPRTRGHKRSHSNVSSAHSGGVHHYKTPAEKKPKLEEELMATRMSMIPARGSKRKDLEERLEKMRKRDKGRNGVPYVPTRHEPGKHPWDPIRTSKRSGFANYWNYHLLQYKGEKDYDGEKMRGWSDEEDAMKSLQSKRLLGWLESRFMVERKDVATQTEDYRPSLRSPGHALHGRDGRNEDAASVSLDFEDPALYNAMKKMFQQALDAHVRRSKNTISKKAEDPTIAALSAKIDHILEESRGISNAIGGLAEEFRRGLDEVREMVLEIKANQLREGLKSRGVNDPAVVCDPDESWQCLSE